VTFGEGNPAIVNLSIMVAVINAAVNQLTALKLQGRHSVYQTAKKTLQHCYTTGCINRIAAIKKVYPTIRIFRQN